MVGTTRQRHARVARFLAAGAALLTLGAVPIASAGAAEGPRPPCGGEGPIPAYAEVDAVPNVAAWSEDELDGGWRPPACTGWADAQAQTLVALAARFRYDGGVDDLLERFGAISALEGVRYWSVSEDRWRDLVEEAHAVTGAADDPEPRADFSAAELRGGDELYFYQDDTGAAEGALYRMRVLEAEPGRLVIAVGNATEVEAAVFVTLFEPAALQSVYFFERLTDDGLWGHYSLTRARDAGTSSFAAGHEKSYINRAVALFRHAAGIPTDREPAVAR